MAGENLRHASSLKVMAMLQDCLGKTSGGHAHDTVAPSELPCLLQTNLSVQIAKEISFARPLKHSKYSFKPHSILLEVLWRACWCWCC